MHIILLDLNKNMQKNLLFFILVFILFSSKEIILASDQLNVVINEIAWMGTNTSYNDEWIEIYNNTNSSIDLNDWILKAIDGTPEIILSGTIQPNGFYILERTDDTTIPNITADQIYTGALSNKGEYLQLFDTQNNLIDEINCTDGWLAGDNKTKQTMERVNPTSLNWQTSKNSLGTPRTINSIFTQQEPQQEQESIPESKLIQELEEQTEKITYPLNIVFSEILPSPDGPDSENEFIEILNNNDFDVDLSDWKIKDSVGSITTYVFPKNSIIKSKDYLVVLRPETEITLNNDADSLHLIQPDSTTIDTLSYEKAPRAQSYNLTSSGWFWSEKLTPENDNTIEQEKEEPKKLIIKESTNKPENKEILKDSGKMIASLVKQTTKTNNQFLKVFSIAFIFAVFSSITILMLKKVVKKSLDSTN